MLLPEGVTFGDFISALSQVAVTAAPKAKVPVPSLNTPPDGINPKAQKRYWKEFVKKYESVWSKYKKKTEIEKQWACCVAIWVNYCLKRKIQPFDEHAASLVQETKDKIEDRTENARVAQLNAIDSLLSKGARKGIVSKFLKETFNSLEEAKPGTYSISSKRLLTLEKGTEFNSKEFKDFMQRCNFQYRAGRYTRPVKTNTDVVVQLDKSSNRPAVFLQNSITKAYAEMLLGMRPDKDNGDKVKAGLIKYWKSLIRDLT